VRTETAGFTNGRAVNNRADRFAFFRTLFRKLQGKVTSQVTGCKQGCRLQPEKKSDRNESFPDFELELSEKVDRQICPSTNLTVAEAADKAGVHVNTMKHAIAVDRKGSPELISAVKRGDIAVSAAAQVVKAPTTAHRLPSWLPVKPACNLPTQCPLLALNGPL